MNPLIEGVKIVKLRREVNTIVIAGAGGGGNGNLFKRYKVSVFQMNRY